MKESEGILKLSSVETSAEVLNTFTEILIERRMYEEALEKVLTSVKLIEPLVYQSLGSQSLEFQKRLRLMLRSYL